ncbi:MAG: AAA family ATPase [Candidatus Methanomethylophilaceae archaeon]|nr:AAA family ATPase [Candidatus Methanomethylophilaceae archaeon]
MLRIISTGKGGVGKTTTISTLATMMAKEGRKVLVFDTDPSMNLAMTLGIPYQDVPTITENKEEISEELDEMEEENAMAVGKNILDNYSKVNKDGIRIIIMGAIPEEGNGCLCSAVAIVKILMNYVDSDRCPETYDAIFVDSQAGPEILGRGLAKDFDCNLIMTEPTPKSAEVSKQVASLAKRLGITMNLLVINKSEREEDIRKVSDLVGIEPENAVRIRYDHSVIDADWNNQCLLDTYPECDAIKDIYTIKNKLESIKG